MSELSRKFRYVSDSGQTINFGVSENVTLNWPAWACGMEISFDLNDRPDGYGSWAQHRKARARQGDLTGAIIGTELQVNNIRRTFNDVFRPFTTGRLYVASEDSGRLPEMYLNVEVSGTPSYSFHRKPTFAVGLIAADPFWHVVPQKQTGFNAGVNSWAAAVVQNSTSHIQSPYQIVVIPTQPITYVEMQIGALSFKITEDVAVGEKLYISTFEDKLTVEHKPGPLPASIIGKLEGDDFPMRINNAAVTVYAKTDAACMISVIYEELRGWIT